MDGGLGQEVSVRRNRPQKNAARFARRWESPITNHQSQITNRSYSPRLVWPVRLGPLEGAFLAALPASAFPPRGGFLALGCFFASGESASASASPSALRLRTVSTRPPVARRARSAIDSLRGAFSLA